MAAWRHIWQVFQNAGATNVAFVWSIGASGRDQDLINYYPGSAYVDWIAADGYDRPNNPVSFTARFQPWYNEFSGFGLPLMVGESGAVGALRENGSTRRPPSSRIPRLPDLARSGPWATSTPARPTITRSRRPG